MKNSYIGIGIMSGTSLDGIDLCACKFWEENNQQKFKVIAAKTVPYTKKWIKHLQNLPFQTAERLAKTNVEYGHLLGKVTKKFIQSHELSPDFVASHGHTIFHQPDKGFTLQIGDGETFVSHLACPLVSNFRNRDLAFGGQGAPLVPFGEQHLFGDYRLFLNLGGFANLHYQGVAFDVCPCNLVLNQLASQIDPLEQYDPEGKFARKGTVDHDLLTQLNKLPYYTQPPPKSLGTEWLNATVWPLLTASGISPQNQLRTFVAHIALQIQRSLNQLNTKESPLLITGGGVYNRFLMEEIAAKAPVSLAKHVPESWIAYKEAIIFAFLGLYTLFGRPNILASVTGASHDHIGGSIHLPKGRKIDFGESTP